VPDAPSVDVHSIRRAPMVRAKRDVMQCNLGIYGLIVCER
jgi:hypothetical protein